jgi:hypothetical protein
MRTLALAGVFATALLLLAGCGGVIDRCPNGLAPPEWGSTVPSPRS